MKLQIGVTFKVVWERGMRVLGGSCQWRGDIWTVKFAVGDNCRMIYCSKQGRRMYFHVRCSFAYRHIEYKHWHISEFYSIRISAMISIVSTVLHLYLQLFMFNIAFVNWEVLILHSFLLTSPWWWRFNSKTCSRAHVYVWSVILYELSAFVGVYASLINKFWRVGCDEMIKLKWFSLVFVLWGFIY